jgi:exoribonuclease-2
MSNSFDLRALARQAVFDAGFHPDFAPEVIAQARQAEQQPPPNAPAAQDLRNLNWSSIDNDSSLDLDQIEYAEKLPDGSFRLLVGIADVDALVRKGTPADVHAADVTTSLYTGVATFPMLPPELSTKATSLMSAQDRASVVTEMVISLQGEVTAAKFYLALVRNKAKLAYISTGAWLEGKGPMPDAIANTPGMEAQLRLQAEISKLLRQLRKEHGALAFASSEPISTVENGAVKSISAHPHNLAEDLIESFMVAANVAMAKNLREKGFVSISRVVKTPRRWDRIQELAKSFGVNLPDVPDPRALSSFLEQRQAQDPDHFPDLSLSIVKLLGPGEYVVEQPGQVPEGHFGLAVSDYTHSTAPNRRFTDLVIQRLVKAALSGAGCPYTIEELTQIAAHATEREEAARKVERLMRKILAASVLSNRIGETFPGIITGASPKGTYVRLLSFPAEGRVVRHAEGLDVGDKVQVRLISVEVPKGFIDLEKI